MTEMDEIKGPENQAEKVRGRIEFRLQQYRQLIQNGCLEQLQRMHIARELPLRMEDPETGFGMLFLAIEQRQNAIFEYLLDAGYEVAGDATRTRTLLVDAAGNTALHVACAAGNEAAFLEYAARFPHVVLQCNNAGTTPFMAAAQRGCTTLMRLLAAQGVDVDAQDGRGRTACHYAAAAAQREALETLEGLGAAWSVADADGWTPLDVAFDMATARAILRCARAAPAGVSATFGRAGSRHGVVLRRADAADPNPKPDAPLRAGPGPCRPNPAADLLGASRTFPGGALPAGNTAFGSFAHASLPKLDLRALF